MQWASSGSYKLTKEISSKTFPGTHMQLFFVFSKATANLQTHTDTHWILALVTCMLQI